PVPITMATNSIKICASFSRPFLINGSKFIHVINFHAKYMKTICETRLINAVCPIAFKISPTQSYENFLEYCHTFPGKYRQFQTEFFKFTLFCLCKSIGSSHKL